MMLIRLKKWLLCISVSLFLIVPPSFAAKLAIVIDDFGYRQHNEEQIIGLSPYISIAVLPNSPHGRLMAILANQQGNNVIIHLPMAPISKQALEVDTLYPTMSENEIQRIVSDAVNKVPYAIGVNNHMGSLMTIDLPAMQHVMKSLSAYSLFFLDSRTIAKSQANVAAKEYFIPVLARDVFLDNVQDEVIIAQQFDLAVKLAQKNGQAIVIGHPYPQTVAVLQRKLATLPDDIELVKLSDLIEPPKKVELSELVKHYTTKLQQMILQYLILTQSK